VNAVHFGIGQDLDIGMPVDLDQLGCQYSHRTVIRGERLIQLGHMAPDARRFLNQVYPEARSSKIKRGLNTADAPTNDQYVAEGVVPRTFADLLHSIFQRCYAFHFPLPFSVPVKVRSKKLEVTSKV